MTIRYSISVMNTEHEIGLPSPNPHTVVHIITTVARLYSLHNDTTTDICVFNVDRFVFKCMCCIRSILLLISVDCHKNGNLKISLLFFFFTRSTHSGPFCFPCVISARSHEIRKR